MARISTTLCALRVAMSKVTMSIKHRNAQANNKALIRQQDMLKDEIIVVTRIPVSAPRLNPHA
jgi:hypothetical protein